MTFSSRSDLKKKNEIKKTHRCTSYAHTDCHNSVNYFFPSQDNHTFCLHKSEFSQLSFKNAHLTLCRGLAETCWYVIWDSWSMRERRGRSWNTKWDFVSALILKAVLFHLPVMLHMNRKLKDHVRKFPFTFWWSDIFCEPLRYIYYLVDSSQDVMLTDVILPLMQDCVVCLDVSVVPTPSEAQTCWWDQCVWEQTENKNKAENKFVQQTPIRFNL